MRVIKNPLELQARINMLIEQWEFINSQDEIENKAEKLEKISTWILSVNTELESYNNLVIKEVSK
jgi:hypothetical protein